MFILWIEWKQQLELYLVLTQVEVTYNVHPKDHKLLFEVFNWDALNKNNYIGEVIIELATIPDNDKGIVNKVYNITDREGENSPSIKLSLQFDQTGGKELH